MRKRKRNAHRTGGAAALTPGALTAVALFAVGPVAVAHAAPRPSSVRAALTEASLPSVLADVEALNEPILSLPGADR